MKGSAKNVELTPLDELFTTEDERAELRREKVRRMRSRFMALSSRRSMPESSMLAASRSTPSAW